MNTEQMRNFNCKDEELPVICEYVAITLGRDLSDFTAFSPKFNQIYLNSFKEKIVVVTGLVNPKTETAKIKSITAQMYATADGLTDSLNRLEAYLKLAKDQIPVSANDFGISPLRKDLNRKNMEGALLNLHLVSSNIEKYRPQLEAEGMTDNLVATFDNATESIASDNRDQYEILTQRIELVRNNISKLNDLYGQMAEICEIGKTLFKKTAPEKAKEYTFTYLLKKVRHSTKGKSGENEAKKASADKSE
ncbi:MAG: hypothetical protein LBD45_05115 [Bacteroidales bacterium]|nr:hypothetical protein [Bacteroidales bacterium]